MSTYIQDTYYKDTWIDKLPLELQDKIGVPVVVGRLLTLPLELLEDVLRLASRTSAAARINRSVRGYLERKRAVNWSNVQGWRPLFNMRQAAQLAAMEEYIVNHNQTWLSAIMRRTL
ncbi:MAG: hypothetical protein CMJ58_06360 [Planctomycetaceae bacterium]|jgi:hypothetical protein|nr:hypothetical protein [Planctomycetaceae bacterium]